MPVLCPGEALVDLIRERRVEHVGDADPFVPRFGGASVAVAAAAALPGAAAAAARACESRQAVP